MSVVISGTGLFTPSEYITNEELVRTFNEYVEKFNEDNKELISSGDLEALVPSSSEFIKKASGIELVGRLAPEHRVRLRQPHAHEGDARSSDAPIRHWLTARRTGWRTSTSSRASGSHLGSHCAARRLPR